MANPLDTDAGSELFSSYEAEFKVVQADLEQKLDQIPELSGEPRKAAVSQAERALEEADELVCPSLPSFIPHLPVCLAPGYLANWQELTPQSSAKCASKSKTSPPPPAQR